MYEKIRVFPNNCTSVRVQGVHLSRLHHLCYTGFMIQLGSKGSMCYYELFGCKEIYVPIQINTDIVQFGLILVIV